MSKTYIDEAIEIDLHKLAERIIELEKDSFKIVHCEDCKYWCYDNFNDEGEITDAWCGRPYAGFMSMTPDDFCSRGEKE